MLSASRLVPYRVRNWLDSRRLDRDLDALRKTSPLACGAAATARAELFMLLCRRDLWVGILAVKSLLRFADGQLAATLIDDGSLGGAGRAIVDTHLPGCRWLHASTPPPDDAEPLKGHPRVTALVHSGYVPYPKLVFPRAYARTDRVILLDADTAFFQRPAMLLDWVSEANGSALYLHDHRRDDRDEAPPAAKQRFAEFRQSYSASRRWSLPHFYFNSGLLAFEPRRLDFDIAEAFLEWNRGTPAALRSGRAGIWFGPWTPEQTAYMVMYGYMDPPPQPFGRQYRLEEPGDGVFCHFLRAGLMQPAAIRRLQGVVAELPSASGSA